MRLRILRPARWDTIDRVRPLLLLSIAPAIAFLAFSFARPPEIPFKKHELDLGSNEAVTFADVCRRSQEGHPG